MMNEQKIAIQNFQTNSHPVLDDQLLMSWTLLGLGLPSLSYDLY